MTRWVKCGVCGSVSPAKFTWSFPGIRRFVCPGCKSQHRFGLSRSTKIIYAVFLLLLGYAMYVGIAQPGILVFVVAYAFYKDYEVRNGDPTAVLVSMDPSDSGPRNR